MCWYSHSYKVSNSLVGWKGSLLIQIRERRKCGEKIEGFTWMYRSFWVGGWGWGGIDDTSFPQPSLFCCTVFEFLNKYWSKGSAWTGIDLRFCPCILAFKYWTVGFDRALPTVPITCGGGGGGSFLLTNSSQWYVLCDTWRRMRLNTVNRGGNPRLRLRSKDLRLNTSA